MVDNGFLSIKPVALTATQSTLVQVCVDLAQKALDDAMMQVDNYMPGELETVGRPPLNAGFGLFTGALTGKRGRSY